MGRLDYSSAIEAMARAMAALRVAAEQELEGLSDELLDSFS
jgi:hypothetical protein